MARAAKATAKVAQKGDEGRGARGDLSSYRAMRDFTKTAEPSGAVVTHRGGEGLRFVIQKHAARRLHYDLRLELHGVFKSWAVARGPSLDPHEKRLAVHVEDHPLDYGDFEGIIPKGEYGGGTVMIWDRGIWVPEGDPEKGYQKGHLAFDLDGQKLLGRWHLVRTKGRPGEKKEQWLLFKSDDDFARATNSGDILDEAPYSAATNRSLDDIARDQSAVWSSRGGLIKGDLSPEGDETSEVAPGNRKKPAKGKQRKFSTSAERVAPSARHGKAGLETPSAPRAQIVKQASPSSIEGAQKAEFLGFVEPCLALAVEAPPAGAWLHEIKFDGYRLEALINHRRVRLMTRSGLDWTHRFPSIAEFLKDFPAQSAIIDGEAVIEDENGVSSFSALQDALSDGKPARKAVYYAFDLMFLDGYDLRNAPLERRKEALAARLPASGGGVVQYSSHIVGAGREMFEHACRLGLEGVISKRATGKYRSGRHGDWVKSKCIDREEFVVGGFVPSTASRNAIGSLALGYYKDGKLIHVGRTGTGFTAKSASSLFTQLKALRMSASPFANPLTAAERRGLAYVEPRFVAEVEFRGWTNDGHLRHAAFKGLRDDKPATEVGLEMATKSADKKRVAPRSAKQAGSAEGKQPAPAVRPSRGGAVEIAGIKLTHPDRVLWEAQGLTKLGLAQYYVEVADLILPHITARPLALVRCPQGSEGECFFQKHAFAGLTEAVEIAKLPDKEGETEAIVIHDLRGLINLVQANVLEIHPWGARIEDVDHPDTLIFDLDPGDGVTWDAVIEAAKDIRKRLRATGIESFVKTSGGKGLHVVAHLLPSVGWEELKAFTHSVALAMEREEPSKYISTMTKKARGGKIFVDYLRNGKGATAVAPYSTRARLGAPVSTPVRWDELGAGMTANRFTVENIGRRLSSLKSGPWDDFLSKPQDIARAISKGREQQT